MIYLIEVRKDTNGKVVDIIDRAETAHRGWVSVKYKGLRYQLFGGIRVPYYINLSRPLGNVHKWKKA